MFSKSYFCKKKKSHLCRCKRKWIPHPPHASLTRNIYQRKWNQSVVESLYFPIILLIKASWSKWKYAQIHNTNGKDMWEGVMCMWNVYSKICFSTFFNTGRKTCHTILRVCFYSSLISFPRIMIFYICGKQAIALEMYLLKSLKSWNKSASYICTRDLCFWNLKCDD